MVISEEVEKLLKECNELLDSCREFKLEYIEKMKSKKEKLAKYQIKVIGLAKTKYKKIQKLDGIECQDNFVKYLNNSTLKDKLITGYLQFEVIDNKLYSITTYTSIENLTNEELDNLGKYTQDQWSDGIGEGFEQVPCYYDSNNKEIFISPWYYGQEIQVIQEELKDI